jgi:membrane fusion protein, multidrug efflux system
MSGYRGPDMSPANPQSHALSRDRLPGSRSKSWTIGGIVLFLVAALGGTIHDRLHHPTGSDSQAQSSGRRGSTMAGPGAPAMPVITVKAATGDLDVYLNGLGTVTPAATVTVRSRVDGQLMKAHFVEGHMVKAGALLAEIDPRPFQVQVAQMEGQLARDEASLKNAQLDLQRYETLAAQDSIAKQTVDTQRALVRQYEGTVKADKGQLGNAMLQLTYANVTAPVSGRVGLRQVDPGNIVRATDATGLVVINQVQPITVVYTVPEDSLPRVLQRLNAGQVLPVDAYDRGGGNKLASGHLLTVDNQIDITTGTVKLKAAFANENGALFPNQFVNVKMLVDTLRGATLIPTAAVQRGSEGNFVYAVQPDQTVKLKTVKLGPSDGSKVAVEAGVAPGEQLVIDGMDKLRDGAKVAGINPAAAPTAPELAVSTVRIARDSTSQR